MSFFTYEIGLTKSRSLTHRFMNTAVFCIPSFSLLHFWLSLNLFPNCCSSPGQEQPYVKEVELQTMHDALYIQSFEQFDEIATMG